MINNNSKLVLLLLLLLLINKLNEKIITETQQSKYELKLHFIILFIIFFILL